MPGKATRRLRLRLAGQVQGVGFRPYAYRLARSMGLTGHVSNDAAGATIEVQGRPRELERFAERLPAELPPLAEVRRCRREAIPTVSGETGFAIRPSTGGEMTDAEVTVDTATCPACLAELSDPADRRYRYPFINCTNCGPRYSIIRRVPYDRPNTTMAEFAMCGYCGGQYTDPSDRRFHAQPIACPACGPSCWLTDAAGRQVLCDDPIAHAAGMLAEGRIVAVKGLGGFHLACRADDASVVARVRQRKDRDDKPFALMVRDVEQARRVCEVDAGAEAVLTGPLRPILLLPRRPDAPVAEAVAPRLDTLGLMLPYTPLHHLLLARGLPPLVMTSGNVSDEPLVTENDDAIARLGRIADAMLLHNRRIERGLDDSVAQWRSGGPVVLRRARGYAPRPLPVTLPPPEAGRPATVLAVGAELKSAVCFCRAGRALLSEHVGDLTDGRTYRRFMRTVDDLEALFDLVPDVLAADMHPSYLSTDYARRRAAGQLAGRPPVGLVRVQHHHAHVVSCLAEHGRTDEVIGIACDGAGYGTDGATWGCEVLRASAAEFERLGHLRCFPLAGGDAAAVETARPAMALLMETFGVGPTRLPAITGDLAAPEVLDRLIEQLTAGVNCPPTSSLGRLFDAVAALCGVARENRYEGEAPMLLEAAAAIGVEETYPFALTDETPFRIDVRPTIEAVVAEVEGGTAAGTVSARFHNTVAAFLAAAAERARGLTGLGTAALSGGCFANRYLSARLEGLLRAAGFEVLAHLQIPCNDGGVALGQAVIAAHRAGAAVEQRSGQNVRGGPGPD